jgi:exosortase
MTTDSATFPPSESPAPNPSAQAAPIARSLGWLAAGVLILLWVYAAYRLGTLWYSSKDYAYGWFVPLLCLALFWERWKHRPAPELLEASTGPLIVFAVLALTLLPSCLFLEVIPFWRFASWAFAGAIVGITFCALYLIGGRSWVHHFAFPLLFFLVAVPWPSRLEVPLIAKMSHLNAALSTWAANWLGTPAIRQGVVIQTGGGMAGVDEACSGIRSFQATVMVALFLGELFRYTFFRRIFFLLSGSVLAFGCNVVRTTYLVRICDLKGKDAVNQAHDPAGFTILAITLAGLLVLAWFLRPKERSEGSGQRARAGGRKSAGEEPQAPDPNLLPATERESAAELEVRTRWSEAGSQGADPATGSRDWPGKEAGGHRPGVGLKGALVGLVLWIVAVEAGIEAWFRPTENQAASRSNWSLQLPSQQPGFREPPIRDAVRSMLKYDEGKQAEWREVNGRPWQVYYLRWFPARTRYRAMEVSGAARGHAPDVCLQLAGMTLQKNSGSQLRQINGVTLLANVERFLDQGRPLHVLSCYWEPNPAALENRPASSPPSTANALRNAWHALQIHERTRNEKCVLKIGVWGMETDEEAEAAFRELLERTIRS